MWLSRRELFDRLALGVQLLPALAFAPRSLMGDLLFEPDGEPVPARPIPPNPFQRNGKALVAIVHGRDPAVMLEKGMELLGGLHHLEPAGKRVLVKPNVVNDRPPPTTSSPAVITAVVQAMQRAGAAEVTVADSSGVIRFPTAENLEATGIMAAVEATGGRTLALEDQPWVRLEPAGAEHLTRFYLSRPVYEAELLINLPVVKTHKFASYSCCLKNLVGIAHPRNRPSVTFLAGNWHERIAELNLGVHPHLNIADGTTIMIAGGPTSGTPAQADLLLLSGDRVALDAVAVALIRSYRAWPKVMGGTVWSQRQIKRAGELGLGAPGVDGMELVAASTDGSSRPFDRLVQELWRDLRGEPRPGGA